MMICGTSSLLQCVICHRDARRTAGAKGISCRVSELILHMEVLNLSRGSGTIADNICAPQPPWIEKPNEYGIAVVLLVVQPASRSSIYYLHRFVRKNLALYIHAPQRLLTINRLFLEIKRKIYTILKTGVNSMSCMLRLSTAACQCKNF